MWEYCKHCCESLERWIYRDETTMSRSAKNIVFHVCYLFIETVMAARVDLRTWDANNRFAQLDVSGKRFVPPHRLCVFFVCRSHQKPKHKEYKEYKKAKRKKKNKKVWINYVADMRVVSTYCFDTLLNCLNFHLFLWLVFSSFFFICFDRIDGETKAMILYT